MFPLLKNQYLIFDLVRRYPGITRAKIQNHLPLPQQTVHRIVGQLAEMGLLEQSGPATEGRGKPTPPLQVSANGAHAFGLAFNSQSLELVAIDLTGRLIAQKSLISHPNDIRGVLRETEQTCSELSEKHNLPEERNCGLGISMQGFRAGQQDSFRTHEQLDFWFDRSVHETFGPIFGEHVYPENDAVLGAIAETWNGVGVQHSTFAYLGLSFGLGGGLILNGEPFFGANWNAAEYSRMYLPHELPVRPTLRNLMRFLGEHGVEISELKHLPRRGDEAWPLVEEWGQQIEPMLNLLIRALCSIIDPSAIVIGGEASEDIQNLIVRLCDPTFLDRQGSPVPGPVVVSGTVKGDSSARGAAVFSIRSRLQGMYHAHLLSGRRPGNTVRTRTFEQAN